MTQPLIEHLLQWIQELLMLIIDIVLPMAQVVV